jgi:PPIC-type PPIASE domain
VKRFLVLLVVLAGGLAAAAFTVPSNAATVNGTNISQQDLNSDVSAIANSTYYQCYLNSQEYLSSEGEQELPPVLGAGTGQYAGDHPTATSAFVASYLETDIGHQLLLQAAAEHHVSVTETDLASARSNLTEQISEVMSEILQTQQAQNVRYSCSLTGQALTGEQVVSTLPASFVDAQVQFVAEATALQEDLAGVGSSEADLQNYFAAHGAQFDTACLSAAVYSSQSAAEAGALEVLAGTPFATVAAATSGSGGGALGCDILSDLETKLPAAADLKNLATGAVSAPIDDNGTYVLLQITSRTPTPFSKAKAAVVNVVQQAGSTATQKLLTADERRSSVSVNPQYGVWVPVSASVLIPFAPEPSDVLNPSANVPVVPVLAPASGSSGAGLGSSPTGTGSTGTGTTGTGTTGTGNTGAATGNTATGNTGAATGNTATGNTGAATPGVGNSGTGSASTSSGSASSTPTTG